MRPSILLGILAGLLALPAARGAEVGPFPGVDDKWRHFRSPHFELYSRANDRQSRELLRNLELVRATFLTTLKIQERLPKPVTVFLFGTERDFRAYLPPASAQNRSIAAMYFNQLDRAAVVMLMRPDEKVGRQLIFHEYVHHLMRVGEENPAPWYSEGMAELFSTIEEESGSLTFGQPPIGRTYQLQTDALMPLERLFAVTRDSPILREGRHMGIFYSQSWALLHLCYFGITDLPREKLDQFLKLARMPALAENPEALRATFQELLGIDYPRLSAELKDYVFNGRYRSAKLPVPAIEPVRTYATRAVPQEEIQVQLADLLLRTTRSPLAKLALLQTVTRQPENPRPHESLGTLARYEGDVHGARDHWEKAVAAGSDNPSVLHELGLLESQRWFRQYDLYFRLPEETATRLRALLQHSISYAPLQSAAYELLAWVEATAHQPDVANINLVQKQFPVLKDQPRTLVALATVRWRLNDPETAVSLLDTLATMETTPWVEHAAETLRAGIEKRRPQYNPRVTGPRQAPVQGMAPTKAPTLNLPK